MHGYLVALRGAISGRLLVGQLSDMEGSHLHGDERLIVFAI